MKSGYNLETDGYDTVRDGYTYFSALHKDNYLYVSQPGSMTGYYKITDVSLDRQVLTIEPTISSTASLPLPLFTNGIYRILNVTDYRSGLQNGFFTFEENSEPGKPYYLSSGFYDLVYDTYLSIEFDPSTDERIYFGSDLNKENAVEAILDQVKIHSVMLSDIRVGESSNSSVKSITKDFNSLKALKADDTTLVLINFDKYPFTNEAKLYRNYTDVNFVQSNYVVNSNFANSLLVENGLQIENDGILDTRKEGTIEFWLSPRYDTGNDPSTRYYFDGYSAVVEEVVSLNNSMVEISGSAKQILNVTVEVNPHKDYFAGGRIEYKTQNAIQETTISVNTNTVIVSKDIFQVLYVKITDDVSNKDYFNDGFIGTDKRTIYLGTSLPQSNLNVTVVYKTTEFSTLNKQIILLNKRLPYQNTKVKVVYLPKGLNGDRISLFKDNFGYINFAVRASNKDFVIRAPTRWSTKTWHRIKASYRFNTKNNTDEMRLFIDGYQYGNVLFGENIIFGEDPIVLGESYPGDGYGITGTISFKDLINYVNIGSDFKGSYPAYALIDNLRISNIFRPVYKPYNEPLDINYNKNLQIVFPVTKDLYTTYITDFNAKSELIEDFAKIRDKRNGVFDFSVNIFDSFGIVNSSLKVKEILEKLIKILKPANSKVFINYI